MSLLLISLREQDEHKLPPKGRSGRFSLFESLAMPESLAIGTPCSGFLHTAHLATAFFRLLKCVTLLPPGVLTLSLLSDLDLRLLLTIQIILALNIQS